MNETTRSRLKDLLLAEIPSLRAFALSLSGNSDRADDLVQDTLMKAWANASSFMEGTNMRAWLFTIMRNTFFSQYRKARREIQDVDGEAAARLVAMPDQLSHLDFADFKTELDSLPADQREALVLIGASGFSYEEAAEICGCAVGTIKSRVNRARHRLMTLLSRHRPRIRARSRPFGTGALLVRVARGVNGQQLGSFFAAGPDSARARPAAKSRISLPRPGIPDADEQPHWFQAFGGACHRILSPCIPAGKEPARPFTQEAREFRQVARGDARLACLIFRQALFAHAQQCAHLPQADRSPCACCGRGRRRGHRRD